MAKRMLIRVLRSKVHRAAVTEADPDYVGSITIDMDLADAAGLLAGEFVLVADLNNGQRFQTYVMPGRRRSGTICINGAAARLVDVGDRIIIMGWAYVTPEEARSLKPAILVVNERNEVVRKL